VVFVAIELVWLATASPSPPVVVVSSARVVVGDVMNQLA